MRVVQPDVVAQRVEHCATRRAYVRIDIDAMDVERELPVQSLLAFPRVRHYSEPTFRAKCASHQDPHSRNGGTLDCCFDYICHPQVVVR
jgi:hypothetical protein